MRHLRWLVLSFFLIALTHQTAHAGIYFEYAPDPWRSARLAVSTAATPYQFFQSATDFDLTGFSFWIDNTGTGGEITFTLLDDENNTLASETVSIGQISAIPGGTKLRVPLDNPIPISHYQTYSIQISSSLLGLGLYYANRIDILEHNLNYTNEYAMGVAQLGSEQQSYTFKFSLEDPTESSNQGPEEDEEVVSPEETPTPVGPVATVISNARITSITGTTAVAAWTTNLAADSRVTVRSQLSPLYVYTTSYDDALELEHALTITGLTPLSGYFVDFFSQQNADEPILTTYTVAFTTGAATEEELAAIEEAAEAAAAQSSSTASTSAPTTPQATTETQATASSTATNLPAATFAPGSGGDSFSVTWQTPADGAPNGGYRIDIFDENNQLVRQLRAPGDATSRTVAILPPGDHTVIVYADQDGVYKKVVAPTAFEAKKARSPLFWFWYLMGVILALVVAFAFLFSKREKTELPKLD